MVLLPEPGTLVAFDSGNANLHCVERVSRGSRFALTMWFTSSPPPADLLKSLLVSCVFLLSSPPFSNVSPLT